MTDITANKHHGNAASETAFRKGNARHQAAREKICQLLQREDMTSKEIAERTGWAMHTFSGRLTELKRDGLVTGTGVMRRGAEVLRVVKKEPAEQLSLLEVA